MRFIGRRRMRRRFRRRRQLFGAVFVAVIVMMVAVFLRVVNLSTHPSGRISVPHRPWYQLWGRHEPQVDAKVAPDGSLDVQSTSEGGEKGRYRVQDTPDGPVIVDMNERLKQGGNR